MALLHIHEVQDDEWFCLWISHRYKYTYIPKSTYLMYRGSTNSDNAVYDIYLITIIGTS